MRGVIATVDRPYAFAAAEPIVLGELKKHLRFGSTTEDVLLETWIAAARILFEGETGRQVVTATYEYALDQFPIGRVIELPRPPLQAVISVKYDDADGHEQTLDPAVYRVLPSLVLEGSPAAGVIDPYCPCGRLELVPGATWPTTACQAEAVRIRRTCGYGATAAEIPELIKGALYFLIGHFHRNRSEVTAPGLVKIPLGASMLIDGFKYTALPTCPPRSW